MRACEYRLDFYIEAAHHMGKVFGPAHPNSRIHGHTYHGVWIVDGTPDVHGVVIEVEEAKQALKTILNKYDHNLLNDIPGLENPTTEMIAYRIFEDLKELETRTVAVELYRPSVGLRIRYPSPRA